MRKCTTSVFAQFTMSTASRFFSQRRSNTSIWLQRNWDFFDLEVLDFPKTDSTGCLPQRLPKFTYLKLRHIQELKN